MHRVVSGGSRSRLAALGALWLGVASSLGACGRADVGGLGGGLGGDGSVAVDVGALGDGGPDASAVDAGDVPPDAGRLDAGVPPIDGGLLDIGVVSDAGPADLGLLFDADVPDALPPDLGVGLDATLPDLGVGLDATLPDLGVGLDALPPDLGVGLDATLPDLGVGLDATLPDLGVGLDATLPDLGVGLDAGRPDVGLPTDAGTTDGGGADAGDPCAGVDCSALSAPCRLGVCFVGRCLAVPLPDGASCDDGDACTSATVCRAGTCGGGARPIGDTCASPTVVPLGAAPGSWQIDGDTGCLADDEQLSCAPPGGDDAVLALDVTGGARRLVVRSTSPAGSAIDAVLALRSTCTDPASELICDDDGAGTPHARLEQVVQPGRSWILLDSGATSGAFGVEVSVDPQDTCAGIVRLPLPTAGSSVRVEGTTVGATDQFQASCAGRAAAGDHVYEIELATRQALVFQTSRPGNGRGYDTALHVRPAPCAPGPATSSNELACDDDGAGDLQSRIELTLDPGRYQVIVDGFASSVGGYVLTISAPGTTGQRFDFPEPGDAFLFQNMVDLSTVGDFVEGVRSPMAAARLDFELLVDPTSSLSCGSLDFRVSVAGRAVGRVSLNPGDPALVGGFRVAGVTGAPVAVRFELIGAAPPGCGGVRFAAGSSITFR